MKRIIGRAELVQRLAAGETREQIFGDGHGGYKAKLVGPEASVAVTSDEKRTMDFVISTESIDRYGDTIKLGGWRLANFKRNPVVLFQHFDDCPPIGRAFNIRAEGAQLRSSVEFAPKDAYPFADTIFQLLKGKFLNAASVGFVPIEYNFTEEGVSFEEQELVEFSVVSVPANPDCLVEARRFGIDTSPLIGWAEQLLDTGGSLTRSELEALRRAAGASISFPVENHMRKAATVAALNQRTDHGFRTLGEFFKALAIDANYPGQDRRLVRAPTGAGEVDPSGGGFLVPEQFESELIGSLYEESVIARLCDRRPTGVPLGAGINVPAIDETSRAEGSRWGGLQVFWDAEAATVTGTFAKFKRLHFDVKKLHGVCNVTDELLADVPMLGAHMKRAFASEMSFKLDLSIFSGTGAGLSLGILKSPALISVAKETGQASATIVEENINKMFSAMPLSCRKRAVWLCHEQLEEQLDKTGNTSPPGSAALYMPRGASGNLEYPLLKGCPLLSIEQANAVGSLGDLVFADLSQYIIIDGGIKPALSVHVRFVSDEAVFRFTLRIDGQPAWASPITPYTGTGTRSPFVALAAR